MPEDNRVTQRRHYWHRNGDHSLCLPNGRCPDAPKRATVNAETDSPPPVSGHSRKAVDAFADTHFSSDARFCTKCAVTISLAQQLADAVDSGRTHLSAQLMAAMKSLSDCNSPEHRMDEYDPIRELIRRRENPDYSTGRPFALTGNREVDANAKAEAIRNGWTEPVYDYTGPEV